jgi:hypothetical protein
VCLAYANVNSYGLANGNGNCDGGSHSDSHGDSHGYGYCYCHTNAYGYTDAAGYSYSKTSPNAEASPVALIGTVKAGTRETNSRVPRLRATGMVGIGFQPLSPSAETPMPRFRR